MIRCVSVLVAAGLMTAGAAGLHAAEAANAKLLGTWTHHCGDYRVKLEIKPDRLHCLVSGPDGIAFALDADYVVSKDGVLLGIIRAKAAAQQDDEDALQDRLFYFRVTARERMLKVSELNYGGGDEGDKTKDVLEGTYVRHDGRHAGATPTSRTEHPSRPVTRANNPLEVQATDSSVSDDWQRARKFFTPPSSWEGYKFDRANWVGP